MDDKELVVQLSELAPAVRFWPGPENAKLVEDAAARLTALAEENERLRQAVKQAHVDLGADCGVTERDCDCEVCRG